VGKITNYTFNNNCGVQHKNETRCANKAAVFNTTATMATEAQTIDKNYQFSTLMLKDISLKLQ
jgi:hypothetical protein